MTSPRQALPIAVLISGRGSNLQAIIDAVARGELAADIRLVLSNRAGAQGLERARAAGIATAVIESAGHGDRAAYDRALRECLDASGARLVVLAGFMRVLSPEFVRHYQGRLINIHPSLLPAFTGLHTHRRALAEGVAEHGASVHFVTEELDGGPVILRARVPVMPGDDEQALADRVHRVEHRILPLAIGWFAAGRLGQHDGQAVLDGRPLAGPVDLADRPAAGGGDAGPGRAG
ncbi:MAG: phosphoribosylglycinamide formyltransferase [Gammaproteobacteria bacterium]|nr:phosphoribosylglycinamide formyltransferase [Gammaproteobacteria bacterium]